MPEGDTVYVQEDHCLVLRDGRFERGADHNVRRVFDAFDARQVETLVVHFHGGLVPKSAGLGIAKSLTAECYGGTLTPYFFVWQSGLLDALKQSLPQIVDESVFQRLLEKVSQWVVGKIDQHDAGGAGGRGGKLVPASMTARVKPELAKAKSGAAPFGELDPHQISPDEMLEPSEERELADDAANDSDLKREASKIANGLRPAALQEARRRRSPPQLADAALGTDSGGSIASRPRVRDRRLQADVRARLHRGLFPARA